MRVFLMFKNHLKTWVVKNFCLSYIKYTLKKQEGLINFGWMNQTYKI